MKTLFLVLLFFVAFFTSCATDGKPESANECTTDRECFNGTYCNTGECMPIEYGGANTCKNGAFGGECVIFVRNVLGGSYDEMPGLCQFDDSCGAFLIYDHWDFGFNKSRLVPKKNALLVIKPWDGNDKGHVAIVRNIEEKKDSIVLTVDESNVVARGIVSCGAKYEFDKNKHAVKRSNFSTWWPIEGFVYTENNSGNTNESICGDGILDRETEECELNMSLSKSCTNYGFNAGNVKCSNSCEFDISGCYNETTQECPSGTGFYCKNDALYYCKNGEYSLQENCKFGCKINDEGVNDICKENPCNNGKLDSGEECDSNNFNGETCISKGFDSGSLICNNNCKIDTSSCQVNTCTDGEILSSGNWSECEYSSACNQTGFQERVVTKCHNNTSITETENRACNRNTNGISCGSNMICESKECVEDCQENAENKCVGNKIYSFDSCGNRGNLVESCSYNETCENAECVENECTPQVTSFTPTTVYLNDETVFTARGTCLNREDLNTILWIAQCEGSEAHPLPIKIYHSNSKVKWKCTPKWSSGAMDYVIKEQSGGNELRSGTIHVNP